MAILQRTGFVRRAVPVGTPKGARALYEIDDVYLAFWFAVLYADVAFVEAGQGRTVIARRRPEWDRHLGWLFEEQARRHATRLVATGTLPENLVVGRWWASSGAPCEVDVLGLRGSRTYLLGEARWQSRPLSLPHLRRLMGKTARVPAPVDEPRYALWGRSGVEEQVRHTGALGFDLRSILTD